MLRKTVDSWNDEGQTEGEEQQESVPQEEVPDLPVYEDPGHMQEPPRSQSFSFSSGISCNNYSIIVGTTIGEG